MRRKDRERDAAFAREVLAGCEYATLATINADNTPYCIPLSPVLVDNAIYFHCATEGQKLTNISQNSAVCLSCVRHTKVLSERFTTEYESVVVTGKCTIVTDEAEKVMALRALCEKYTPNNMEHALEKIEKDLYRTCVCRIEIEQLSGKANLP